MSKAVTFRFAAHKEGFGATNIWLGAVRDNDFYIGVRSLGGRAKVSFHGSGIAHLKLALDNRVETPLRWKRAPTPSIGAVHVLSIEFPTDYTYAWNPDAKGKPGKGLFLLEAAPSGQAVELAFFYSPNSSGPEKELRVIGLPVFGFSLRSGEYVTAVARHTVFQPERIPKQMTLPTKIRPALEAANSLSMMAIQNKPKDGEALRLINIQGLKFAR